MNDELERVRKEMVVEFDLKNCGETMVVSIVAGVQVDVQVPTS